MRSYLAVLAGTARRDPLVQATMVFFVAFAVVQPFVAAADFSDAAAPLVWFQHKIIDLGEIVLLVLILCSLLGRLGEVPGTQEKRFWRRLSVAYGWWFLGAVLRLAPGLVEPLPLRPFKVVLYAFFYIFMIRALEGEPHRPTRPLTSAMERLLTWPAVTFFVLGFMLYFVFVPVSVNWDALLNRTIDITAAKRHEFYLYTLLDLYLSIRFLFLARTAGTRRWRSIYVTLALPWIFFLLFNDLRTITSQSSLAWPLAWIPYWWVFFSFVLQVVAARLRHQPFTGDRSQDAVMRHNDALSFMVSARTLALGVIFPVIHIVATRFVLVDTPGHSSRQALVLTWLIFFGTIALFQHRHLERRAQELWLDRVAMEEEMRASEQDLRLIIERDRASEMVKTSEKKFDLILGSCPYALFVTRLDDGRFLEVNNAFEESFGYRRGDVVGVSLNDLDLWLEPDVVARLADGVEHRREVEEVEVPFRTRGGEKRRGLLSVTEIEVDDVRCLLSIVHDVTERRRQLERLETAARLLDQAQAVIFEIDAKGRIRSWSRGAEEIAGWEADEAVGTRARDLLVPADATESLLSAKGRNWTGEIELVDRDGKAIRLVGWSSPAGAPEASSRLVIATLPASG